MSSFLLCLVIVVTDGDTLKALCDDHQQVIVRLADIDAPEKKQPFGTQSKQALGELCFQKQAEIDDQGKDRYGRILGRVTCAGKDANAEQVRTGMAWVYDKYVINRKLYQLQDEAKTSKRGLWSDKNPLPPWEWRKSKKKSKFQNSPEIKGIKTRFSSLIARKTDVSKQP